MTKKEFLEKMHEYGIKLGQYQIIVDDLMPISYYLGVYKKNRKWLIYEVGERDQVFLLYEETSEEKIFDEFYQKVFSRLELIGIMNETIDQKTIETSKSHVCNFLQKKYNISKLDAEDTWNYLMYDFRILNEVKYFALNNKFVPEDDCYKVHGYSAQDIADKLCLNAVDSYNYLINLEKDSDRYLSKIEMMEESK